MIRKHLPTHYGHRKLITVLVFIFFNATLFAQQNLTVTGRVINSGGSAVSNASVRVKNTQNGTTTDADGNFSITNVPQNATLVFSYVGFTEKEVAVNRSSNIAITLVPADNDLDQVVVIGYGTKRRRDITSAISHINVNGIGEMPSKNPTQLLQGQASGVVVKQKNGQPGTEMEVRVRGISSIAAVGGSNEPLYVVDGLPIGTRLGQNFNPNDIESISVLKDAASTAIYGARGGNGVILITTKTAKDGQLNLNLTADYGIQNIPDARKVKMLNGVDFAQFLKEVWTDRYKFNNNNTEPTIDQIPEGFRHPEQTKYSTNWFEEIMHTNSPYSDLNLTLSSGKGPVASLLSLGYYKEQGALIYTHYERFSVRFNTRAKVNNFVTVGWNLATSYTKQRVAPTDGRDAIVGSALIIDPREPVYNDDGSLRPYIGGKDGVFAYPSPVFYLKYVERNQRIVDVITNGYAEISILKALKFRSSINARLSRTDDKEYRPTTVGYGLSGGAPPVTASIGEYYPQTFNLSSDQLLTYAPQIGNDHKLDLLAGFTAQQENYRQVSATGNTFPNDLVPYLNAAVIKTSSEFESEWSLLAYIGRVNYAFKDKYLLSASFRREGSSRFGASNKYGNFPAASAAWRVSQEEFMPHLKWLCDLKLRASWGITGNNNTGDNTDGNYRPRSVVSSNNYVTNNRIASGVIVNSFANSAIKWEKSNQLDIGMDLGLFRNKVVITAEYYKKTTEDMLMAVSIPVVSGFNSAFSNIGKVENKGIELTIDYRENFGKFNLRNSFNISFNKNKILAINGPNDALYYGGFYGGYNVQKVGRPVGMIYGYEKLGIFNTQEEIDKAPKQDGAIPGAMRFWDADGNGEITYDTKDMVEIGNPNPKFTWGYTIAADYKNFDINILFVGAQDFDVYRSIEASTMNMDGVFNVLDKAKGRWRSAQNPGANPGDLHQQGGTNYFKWSRESSNHYVYDASFMWVKNVAIGYNLPKIKYLNSVRVYASVNNLLLVKNYPGNNPEVSQRSSIEGGADDEAYPVPRTFAIGAKINF